MTLRVFQSALRLPLRVIAVVIGVDDAQAHEFADKVIRADDLRDREQLCNAVSEIV